MVLVKLLYSVWTFSDILDLNAVMNRSLAPHPRNNK